MTTTAQRGTELRCRTWRAEALLRMLENVLEVGERPEDLIVYASLGRAARDWDAYHQIVDALKSIEDDETLVLQTGRPVGILKTHRGAPVVISAVNNTVGRWATPELFYQRMREGKTMWGGLTAAAWQYIGRQGVLGGTYELFRAALRTHFDEDYAAHRWVLTAGMGGMGSAQPISAKMVGLSSLTVEIDPTKMKRLHDSGGIDVEAGSLDEALDLVKRATETKEPIAVGLLANAADVFSEVADRGIVPDIVTDQTAAHDARYGYVPQGMTLPEWIERRESEPAVVERAAQESMATQVRAMLRLVEAGSVAFENGNNLRVQASEQLSDAESSRAFSEIPGFMEAYLRPLFCRGIGPFRWILLSGSEKDQKVLDDLAVEMFPERPEVAEWIGLARKHVPPQGLAARTSWLGYGERAAFALAANKLVADGTLSAPVAFSRDHLDSAGMTHPRIGTEGMRDDSDGVSDWPILDSMLMATAGADLVAVHSGGGGYSGWMQSCGVTVVADGTPAAAERLERALNTDSGLGVMRHATAGYEEARDEVELSNRPESTYPPLNHFKN